MVACNICGGEHFEPGPNDRLTRSGAPPRCRDCRSLERHRSVRACLSRVPADFLARRRAIQFAPDGSFDPNWFRSYEQSQYEGENSLDLQAIDRPTDSYDFISLSGVLEFVPDDRRAFAELLRIGSPECVIHCTFTPFEDVTRHFDEPYGTFGRYHIYGEGMEEWFDIETHGLVTVTVLAIHPVTAEQEFIH